MIKGEDITKKFDDFVALDHACIHVQKGSVYGLVGPNGAGKSTLLRHITGIFKPDSGAVYVEDENIYENVEKKSIMTFIPDDIFYFHQSNLRQLAKFYAGIYQSFDFDVYNKLLQAFPTIDEKRPIRRMSKGMQKQAAFILAISTRPKILILDEPVDGLDPVVRRQVWSILLSEVEKEELTVLVSSHNLRELEDVCDFVGIMNKGSVVIERSLQDLQGNVCKIQVAFADGTPELNETFDLLHTSELGKVSTMIVRGNAEEITEKMNKYHPVLLDVLPLTLEEIFIYEMGGENYEIKDIVL